MLYGETVDVIVRGWWNTVSLVDKKSIHMIKNLVVRAVTTSLSN